MWSWIRDTLEDLRSPSLIIWRMRDFCARQLAQRQSAGQQFDLGKLLIILLNVLLTGRTNLLQVTPDYVARPQFRRRINLKLVLVLLAAFVLLGTGVHFLHAYQVKRNAYTILQQADRARDDGDLEKAESHYRHYLNMVPEDTDALARRGQTLDELAQRRHSRELYVEALRVLNNVLIRDGERHELRRRAVTMAMMLGRFKEAFKDLEVLLRVTPGDAELELLAGQCAALTDQVDEAVRLLRQAIQHAPARAESYFLLASVLLKRKPDQAERVFSELVAANPRSLPLYLARARYYQAQGKFPEADDILAVARERLAPHDPDVLAASAQLALARGHTQEAGAYLERGLEAHAKHLGLLQAQIELELRTGRIREAIASVRRVQKIVDEPDNLLPLLTEALIEAGEPAEAEQGIALLRELDYSPADLDYLVACIHVQRGQWVEGARALEQVRGQLPARAPHVDRLLARCYRETGDTARHLEVSRRLAAVDPTGAMTRLELGTALLAAGQLDRALEEFERVLPRAPQFRVQVARLLALHQMRLPPGQRNWTRVEQLLADASRAAPDSLEISLLRAELLTAQGKAAEARRTLETARDKFPQQPGLWVTLATLVARQEGWEKALVVLEKAGNSREIRLARAGFLVGRRPEEARAILIGIEKEVPGLPASERAHLFNGLAVLYGILGQPVESARLWLLLADEQPDNMPVRLSLFDLARQTGDDAVMKRLLGDIRRIEGRTGAMWHQAEAARLLTKAKQGEAAVLAQARKHLEEAGRLRPDSPRVFLMLAEAEEIEKNPDGAIDHYRQAIKLGERRTEILRRTVQLLYQQRRLPEVNELFRQLQEQSALWGGLGRWAAEVSLATTDHKQALELALQAVPRDSKDPREHLWLGQMLAALERKTEAEEALRRAVQVGEQLPETWVALLQFLTADDRKAEAEALIPEVRRQLPPAEASLGLAFCQETLGNLKQAEEAYQQAVKDRPDNPGVLRVAALFHLRRQDGARAEPLLRRLLNVAGQKEAERTWARRELAFALALTGEQPKLDEALALLEQGDKSRGPSNEDQRVRALILATRVARRPEAIRLFEDLLQRQALPAEDRFRLAQLHELLGDWPAAEKHLTGLLATEAANARYLAHYAQGLLRHDRLDEAEKRLAELEKLDPNGIATLSVKARLRAARKQPAEAVALVRQYVEARPSWLGAGAALLEELDQLAPAEELYRKFVAQSKQPETVAVLVRFLSRRQRLNEALDLCEKLWDKLPAETAAVVSVAALRAGKPGEEHFQRVEPWLQRATQRDPGNLALMIGLSDLQELRGRYDEAARTYRQILQKQGRNIIALNNLAWILALKDGNAAEARLLIDTALKITGPVAELLDTRAMVYLAQGQTDLAVKDLEAVLAHAATASRYFHLALAHQQGKNRPGAEQALKKARALKLDPNTLHPLERDRYQQLVKQLQ